MKLVIIGNGFDLSHGLKTKFSDFKNYLKKKPTEKEFIDSVNYLFEKTNSNLAEEYDWNQIEEIIYKYFMLVKRSEEELDFLDELLDDFSEKFDLYLKDEVLPKIDKVELNSKIKKIFTSNEPIIILDFNFTNLCKRYYFDNTYKLSIHGNISKENGESLNIGYYIKNYRPITGERDYRIKFFNNIICKRCNSFKHNGIDLDQKISNFIDGENLNAKVKEIVSIGYSFGKSDSHVFDLLKSLLISMTDRKNLPSQEAPSPINFTIFDYNGESKDIYNNFVDGLEKVGVVTKIKITGVGYKKQDLTLFPMQIEKYK